MFKYIVKRILLLIPIILGVAAIIFVLKTFTPGDPARQILGMMQHRSRWMLREKNWV